MNYIHKFVSFFKYPFITTQKKNIKQFSTKNIKKTKKYKKKKIPKALKQQVWLETYGKSFERSCYIHWCNNTINCFTFDCGHNIPESKGGETNISNLKPICRNCNLGMGNQYTIDEWNDHFKTKHKQHTSTILKSLLFLKNIFK